MSEYDPEVHGSYRDWLLGKGIQTRPQGWTHATHDQIRTGRTDDGGRYKAVRDQLGHVVTQETTPDGRERQHVRINL